MESLAGISFIFLYTHFSQCGSPLCTWSSIIPFAKISLKFILFINILVEPSELFIIIMLCICRYATRKSHIRRKIKEGIIIKFKRLPLKMKFFCDHGFTSCWNSSELGRSSKGNVVLWEKKITKFGRFSLKKHPRRPWITRGWEGTENSAQRVQLSLCEEISSHLDLEPTWGFIIRHFRYFPANDTSAVCRR